MRIILSGSTGFIGSHFVQKLIQQNVEFALLIRPSSNLKRISKFLDKTLVIEYDDRAKNIDHTKKSIAQFKPDVFVCSGWYGVQNQYRNELNQLEINCHSIIGYLNLFEDIKLKKIIGLGSQAEYGPCESFIDESKTTSPTTYYGLAKLLAYQLFDFFCKDKKIDFAWVRVFSTYGPSDNPTWLIPYMINAISKEDNVKLTQGEQHWDYLHVRDAADAIFSVMINQNATGIFNLGSGTTITIRELAEKIKTILNSNAKLDFGAIPYRPDQVMFLQANITKLAKLASWTPKINLDDGLVETIHWYQTNENSIKLKSPIIE